MFENFSDKLEKAIHSLKGRGKITEINISETLKDVRKALLDADVSYRVAKDFIDKVKQKAIGQKVIYSIRPDQLLIKIVRDELAQLMGGQSTDVKLNGNPAVILMSGLQGSGKTTFSAKLAKYFKEKKGRSILLVACDIYRPAAIDQLKAMGEKVGVEVYTEQGNKNPIQIAKNSLEYAKSKQINTVIIDTAGRLAVDEIMMKEISEIHKIVKPSETLFVVDAMTGQDAVNTAKIFNDTLDFDGVVLTKLDGDTRGGAAFSIKAVVNKPIKFMGLGEKVDSIEVFHPDRIADRILGMGDIVSFVEKAKEQYDEHESRKLNKKIAKNEFGFDDFLSQINQIRKMGNMKDLMGMIPGLGKMTKNVNVDDNVFIGIEAIINSMTPKERENPDIIDMKRKNRISKGSGRKMDEINRLMKQFEDMKKMMKMMKSPGKMNMLKDMMGGMKIPF